MARHPATGLRNLLCVFLCVLLVLSAPALAAEHEDKTVRVGWFISASFQEGGEGEAKSGYCYDYLRKIADYSSWDYEYVYGDWSDLYDMLCSGEIDIMAAMSYSEERAGLMLFPESSMGEDRYYLYKRSDDDSVDADDLTSFNGKRIGLISGNRLATFTENWLSSNGIEASVVYYSNFAEMDADLRQGSIDLAPSTFERSLNVTWITSVASLGKEPYYLAVSRQRPDLLAELNEAVSLMNAVDPYVLQTLQYKNFNTSQVSKALTDAEADWLAEHPVIRVGYMENYLPYSATGDDGQACGIVTDVIAAALEALDLDTMPEVRFVACKGYQDIVAALGSGEIDYGFPVDSDQWRLEQGGLSASTEVISDRGALFYKTVCEKEDIRRLSVNESNVLQKDYTACTYPDAEIVYYPTIGDCLDAVLSGEVDGTIMDTLRVQFVTDRSGYDSLSYVQLAEGTGKCFGVKHGNTQALTIINRGLKLLGSSYGYDCTYKYVDQISTYGARDFILDHLHVIAFSLVCIAVIIVALLMLYIRKQRRELAVKEALKRKAESANTSKSAFLFSMSHDIRTPMNAVLGFNELMLQNIDKPDKLRDYIDKIRVSGEYLLGLINNVLEVARIDSGRETLSDDFADLRDESYCTVFENDVRKKHLNFVREINIEHRYVLADAQKIREILLNIISNAIKYTPDGGTIRLSLTEQPSGTPLYGEYVCEISDTGIGMTEEFQAHVFDTFSRERNTTQSGVMGTGLGMAIVKRLTELMGGTITVKSKPGEGTTFTVCMRLKLVANPEKFLKEAKKAEQLGEKQNMDGKRILLAEDNELNAEIATALLERLGAKVEVAADGIICIDMLQNHEAGYYDLILMDIQMPNLDGYGATRKIRALANHAKAEIPIVAMTANAFDEDRRAAFDAGMDGHIAKPIDINRLTRLFGELKI